MQQNELVGKFHERPLGHEELMFRVFNTVTATGRFAQTPGHQGKRQMELDRDFPDEEEGHTVGGSGVGEVGIKGNPRKLDVFVDFPNDYTRMKVIQSENVAAMIMAQAKPNPYGIPPPLDPFSSDFY
ncbi:hypothetical protein RHMOL_Rhmol13G0156100 [Rhododendron molle]|uniref:Uncharacterized protein n=1 Tax=Rhododendron molle TaxID=49168 RepID=A0ACC0L7D2_RHOML|nr:hypothetical protein RHMOL_Rhmol13G0156100 [Rhododendron molle]